MRVAVGTSSASTVLVSSARQRLARSRRTRLERILVLIPSEILGRDIVAQLAALGHKARATASFDDVLALIDAGAIDTLVLHASAYPSNVLARLGRAMTRRRSMALVAGVSVVSASGADRGGVLGPPGERPAPGKESPWRVGTYWLPFSRLSEFSAGLKGPNVS